MLHKFRSNLSFKSDGNSVNMVNSARRLSYTANDLLLGSRRNQATRAGGLVSQVTSEAMASLAEAGLH